LDVDVHSELAKILIMSAACTIVESFPATLIDDNWSVPATAAGASYLLSMW
jgi:hypothetical protein